MEPAVEVESDVVKVREGRVIIGPCEYRVTVVYSLGVTPVATMSPGGQIFYVPRTNTFRPDGRYVIFFNSAGTFEERIRVCPCDEVTNRFGVDVFAFTPQVVTVTSDPVVPVVVTSEQSGTQKKHQLIFQSDATVYVNVGNAANSRMVTFSVDMSAPIAAGTHNVSHWVEVRGSFNDFGGGDLYRLNRNGNVYSGAFPIVGNAGATVTYKFYGQEITWESRADRTLVLGTAQIAQSTPPAVWNV